MIILKDMKRGNKKGYDICRINCLYDFYRKMFKFKIKIE